MVSAAVKIKLTKRSVEALPASDKRAIFWDSELTGFGVRVMPGGGRVYFLQYRCNGVARWFKIGRHGQPWTAEEARNQARALLGDVARGIDPAEKRRAARERGARPVATFGELCDLYFAEGVAHKKPRTISSDKTRARLHLIPTLGKKHVDEISRGDVEKLLNDVIAGRTVCKPEKRRGGRVPTGGRGVGAQCVALVSTILQFAIGRGLLADNPARGIKKPPVRKLQRFLTFDELSKLANALELEEGGSVHPVAAIRLLALTGCRRGEIVNLKWQDVDLQRRLLHLRDSKTREKAVYLSPAAVEILARLPVYRGNPFVIARLHTPKPSGAVNRTWERVRRRAGLPDVRLHDLRHTFASVGAGASIGLPVIGKLLGHTQASTTARYAHLADDPIRRAADAIGDAIALAMGHKAVLQLGAQDGRE